MAGCAASCTGERRRPPRRSRVGQIFPGALASFLWYANRVMKRTSLLLAGALLAAAPATAQIAEGDQPEHSFRTPVQNGMGVKSLADLRGKPVLVEFWGIN